MKTKLFFCLLAFSCIANAQYFEVGIMSRQFTNENQTQQDIGTTPSGYATNNQTLNGDLFVDRVMSNGAYYRLTVGENRITSNALYQDAVEQYFSDNILLLSKTYNVEKTAQNYDAYIGGGKIFWYHKFSLRTGASVGYVHSQTTNTTIKGIIENSDYTAVNSYTSQTPYNEYLLNFHVSLHYTFWNGLSAGVQIDNLVTYDAEKTIVTTTTNGFAAGGISTSITTSSNYINNKVVNTTFLIPALSIIYSFKKQDAPALPKIN